MVRREYTHITYSSHNALHTGPNEAITREASNTNPTIFMIQTKRLSSAQRNFRQLRSHFKPKWLYFRQLRSHFKPASLMPTMRHFSPSRFFLRDMAIIKIVLKTCKLPKCKAQLCLFNNWCTVLSLVFLARNQCCIK